MTTLVRHEMRAMVRQFGARGLGIWLGIALVVTLFAVLSSPHWAASLLIAIGVTECVLLCMVYGLSRESIGRERRHGTTHLWLSLTPKPVLRLLAKLISALLPAVVAAVFVGVVCIAAIVTERTALSHEGFRFALGHAPTAAFALWTGMRWLWPDIALLLSGAPAVAAVGLALAVGRGLAPRHRGTKGYRGGRIAATWLLVWAAVWVFGNIVAPHVGPLFTLAHGPGRETLVHFVPAGRLDAFVSIAPAVALSIWPLALCWFLGAIAFVFATLRISNNAARA